MTVTFHLVIHVRTVMMKAIGLLLVIRHDSNAASLSDVIWQKSASEDDVPVV